MKIIIPIDLPIYTDFCV